MKRINPSQHDNHMSFAERLLLLANDYIVPANKKQTQLIPAGYSYANFQQTLFTQAKQDNEYELVDKQDVDPSLQSPKKSTCLIM